MTCIVRADNSRYRHAVCTGLYSCLVAACKRNMSMAVALKIAVFWRK